MARLKEGHRMAVRGLTREGRIGRDPSLRQYSPVMIGSSWAGSGSKIVRRWLRGALLPLGQCRGFDFFLGVSQRAGFQIVCGAALGNHCIPMESGAALT